MDTDIKKLLKTEHKNWKQRMVKETKGTYIAIYLGLILVYLCQLCMVLSMIIHQMIRAL